MHEGVVKFLTHTEITNCSSLPMDIVKHECSYSPGVFMFCFILSSHQAKITPFLTTSNLCGMRYLTWCLCSKARPFMCHCLIIKSHILTVLSLFFAMRKLNCVISVLCFVMGLPVLQGDDTLIFPEGKHWGCVIRGMCVCACVGGIAISSLATVIIITIKNFYICMESSGNGVEYYLYNNYTLLLTRVPPLEHFALMFQKLLAEVFCRYGNRQKEGLFSAEESVSKMATEEVAELISAAGRGRLKLCFGETAL